MKLAVKSITKDYRVIDSFVDRAITALSLGLFIGGRPFRALDRISFELPDSSPGTILGILGKNGAGKSTLLNILSGISDPDDGEIEFNGTVRSILELGVGFNPDLSVEQNIFYNGVLWGYSSKTLKYKMNDILDFAMLQKQRHSPLKTLSTGMQMRLAFSLATLEPANLLLVDEALSVGDASFQSRSIKRFREFKQAGSHIIVVSHDTNMLVSVCDRIIVIDKGQVVMDGSPGNASRFYMDMLARDSAASLTSIERTRNNFSFLITDSNNNPVQFFRNGDRIYIHFSVVADRTMNDMTAGISLRDEKDEIVFGTNSRLLGMGALEIEEGEKFDFIFELDANLAPGKYYPGLSFHTGLDHATGCYIWEENISEITMLGQTNQNFIGTTYMNPEIRIINS